MRTFEEHLEDIYLSEDGAMVLDDDLPDGFDNWLTELSVDEFLEYGNDYKKLIHNKVIDECKQKVIGHRLCTGKDKYLYTEDVLQALKHLPEETYE